MPANFAGAETSRRSSTNPDANISAAAPATPQHVGRRLEDRRRSSCGTAATPSPASRPTNIATPPRVGVGLVCTRRSPGGTTAPTRRASDAASGTVAQVTTAAAARTITYLPSDPIGASLPAAFRPVGVQTSAG